VSAALTFVQIFIEHLRRGSLGTILPSTGRKPPPLLADGLFDDRRELDQRLFDRDSR
jgi:hypothetical protein